MEQRHQAVHDQLYRHSKDLPLRQWLMLLLSRAQRAMDHLFEEQVSVVLLDCSSQIAATLMEVEVLLHLEEVHQV
jgi:hypothetical protein